MELREYLSVRRAYNLVRQQASARRRLTFVELAILCRLKVNAQPLNTSEIAEYQGALRPTMTHRTKHLADLGLLKRTQGSADRRNIVCEVTEEGRDFIDDICCQVCDTLRGGPTLSRTTPQRICRYVDAMGGITCMSGDLVLLGIRNSEDGSCTVSDLVGVLGLLQPTVSMAVASLEEEGLVERLRDRGESGRSVPVALTERGAERADELLEAIRAMVVHRAS